jgi:purine-nucleoside phosphorylase
MARGTKRTPRLARGAAVDEVAAVTAAAAFLTRAIGRRRWARVRLGLVLGSGLKDFAGQLTAAEPIPFADVPHWPVPKVQGHGAALVVGEFEGTTIACLSGRVHLYEGFAAAEVVRAVRTLRTCGVASFLLTNAAGGIGARCRAGDLMVIADHLNLTGHNPLRGAHAPAFGPRFPDLSAMYSRRLQQRLARADRRLRRGVYAGLLGPSYETPAEIQMLRRLGAAAVGMSTVCEAIALAAMGGEVAGLSLISNLAAGVGKAPLSHDEVTAAGAAASVRLRALLQRFCRGW